jgi:Cu(I)/Ag(I) efflux system membrane fusion protein
MWYPANMVWASSVARRSCLRGLGALALLGPGLAVGCKRDPSEVRDDGTLLTPYLAIGAVLADDRVEGLGELGAQIVKASEGRAEEAGVADMLAAAGRIGTPDIATARLAYRKLSEGMIAWLAAHPDERAGLELIHCPMAFTNEGAYWVQKSGEIENPYEGSMMLRCGAKLDWGQHRRGQPPAGEVEVEGMKESG